MYENRQLMVKGFSIRQYIFIFAVVLKVATLNKCSNNNNTILEINGEKKIMKLHTGEAII